jgi:hypothetical protein
MTANATHQQTSLESAHEFFAANGPPKGAYSAA